MKALKLKGKTRKKVKELIDSMEGYAMVIKMLSRETAECKQNIWKEIHKAHPELRNKTISVSHSSLTVTYDD